MDTEDLKVCSQMSKVIFFTAIFGPCFARLIVLDYRLRLVFHEGHVIYEQAEDYL